MQDLTNSHLAIETTFQAHAKEVNQVFEHLNSSPKGLSDEEAVKRIAEYGLNELPEAEQISILLLILKQFKSWLVIILIVAAVISFVTNQFIDAWVIIIVVLINGIIGFSQEYRAEKAIAALRKMIVKVAKVIRGGELQTIRSVDLVPGDIVVLEEGDSIPADARIFEAKNVRTKEASLTGESIPNAKQADVLPLDTPLADRENMLYSGTFMATGYARAIITATGVHTAIGGISQSLGAIEERKTNFMEKTDILARQMSVIAVLSAAMIFVTGYFVRDFDMNEILLTSIAALVAAVPEGLPAVISIVLAIGANRMSKRKAIIREFTATETLGAVTAILTDKTGTLTRNTLTVRRVFVPGEEEYIVSGEGWFPAGNFSQEGVIVDVENHPGLKELLTISAISNNSEIRLNPKNDHPELIGDPTEGALSVMSRKAGIMPADFIKKKMDDLPFNSDIKMRATLVGAGAGNKLAIVGAPEKLLERSNKLLMDGREVEMSEAKLEEIRDQIMDWSNHALRVIAIAYKPTNASEIDEGDLDDLVFLGIVGMIDPPRPDTKKAVQLCKRAGIRVIMVTGDHINTAVAIARASGIIDESDQSEVKALTEQQLAMLSEEEFNEAVHEVSVFARLTPKMKLRIADCLQKEGHLIAMTGDGVNDAPALKKADVGISMGIIGTDVARESSDVVLSDDNFSTIVSAVEEGRIVFTNSRQTSFFLVTTNIAESATLLIAIFLGLPIPLTATQILWLNLVTDGVTALALATEPGHGEIMETPPSNKKEQILNKQVFPYLLINVSLMAILSLLTFNYYIDNSVEQARAGVFVMMAFCQLFNVFNLRSLKKSVFAIKLFSNKYINMGVGSSVVLLMAVVLIPGLSDIFRFEPIPLEDFLVLFIGSSSILVAGEAYKQFQMRFRRSDN